MTSSEKRMLLPILRKLANHEKLNHRAQSAAEQLYARLTRKSEKKTQGRLRRNSEKQSARASHNQETAAIREEVFKRAEGGCEAIYGTEDGAFERCDANATDLDHWLGGGGRRRQKQSVETCWALCRNCHRLRTHGSAEFWNEIFRRHCEHYGYPVIGHIIHADPAKAGGAP